MFHNRKIDTVAIDDTEMDYVVFGEGEKNLILIPGLGDGLQTVKSSAALYSIMYLRFAKEYRVYLLSRRNVVPDGFTTRDMAEDVYHAMKQWGMEKAYVLGVSQGGMIAQHLALDHPQAVEKLILTVTLCRQNPVMREVVTKWMEMAWKEDYKGIMIDTAQKSYSAEYLRRLHKAYALLDRLDMPKDNKRFINMAKACLTHDTYDRLEQISCPTLVVGGTDDMIVTGEGSLEIAEKIRSSRLCMYEGLGHGAYTEAKEYWDMVLRFLSS